MSAPSASTRARGAIRAAGGLLGVKEASALLNVKNTNIGKVAGLSPVPGEMGSGPAYLRCEVEAAAVRLEQVRQTRAASARELARFENEYGEER